MVRHHLPDRIEDVGLGAQLEHAVEERGGQIGLARSGLEPGLDLGHGLLGDPEAVAQARELVGGLHGAGGAHHLAGRPRGPVGEEALPGAVHGAGQVVERDRRGGGDQIGQHRGEGVDALVEVEVGRAVQVVVVQADLGGGIGEERREQVGHEVVGQDHRDRPFDVAPPRIAQGPGGPGRVGHVGVAEEDQRVDALVGHGGSHPDAALAPHPREIRIGGEVEPHRLERRRGHQASRPRNVCTLVLTIFTASSGPTASTTAASDCSEYPKVLSLWG